MRKLLLNIFLFVVLSNSANAGYIVNGEVKGWIQSLFSIKQTNVDAILMDDGNLYPLPKFYENVSEYDQYKQRCWIDTVVFRKYFTTSLGLRFFKKENNGEYVEIDGLTSITFPCIKN